MTDNNPRKVSWRDDAGSAACAAVAYAVIWAIMASVGISAMEGGVGGLIQRSLAFGLCLFALTRLWRWVSARWRRRSK